MKPSLFLDYALDYSLDDDTPDGDNCINDNNDDGNCNYDNIENTYSNHLNDNNNHNVNSNHDNNNDDQTIMIFQTMHFVEPFICRKAGFYLCADRS